MKASKERKDQLPNKISDNYNAKYILAARAPKVYPLPRMVGVPKFGSKKFNSYEEFNGWKQELLDQIAASGGVQWTK